MAGPSHATNPLLTTSDLHNKEATMNRLRILSMCLLLVTVGSGCDVEGQEPNDHSSAPAAAVQGEEEPDEASASLVESIDLAEAGRIEFLQGDDGELVVAATFTDPTATLAGIETSPLDTYRQYAGAEPSAELVEAYQRSLKDKTGRDMLGSDKPAPPTRSSTDEEETREALATVAGTRPDATHREVDPFSHHCVSNAANGEDELQYKRCYLNRQSSISVAATGYKSYYTVQPTDTSVTARLKYWTGSQYKTAARYRIAAGAVMHLYHTGGGWQHRRLEVSNTSGSGSFSAAVKVQTKRIVLITIHGAFSGSEILHADVADLMHSEGVALSSINWGNMGSGDIVSDDDEAEDIAKELDELVNLYGQGHKSRIRLLIVGKSAGGVSAWNALRREWNAFKGLDRIALVLIDAHGTMSDGTDEGSIWNGPFSDDRPLFWPLVWTTSDDRLGVWNIYQHTDTITGASFPSSHVFKNLDVSSDDADHFDIPRYCESKAHIIEAIRYLKSNGSAPAAMYHVELDELCG